MHFHGGRRHLDWSRPKVHFGVERSSSPVHAEKVKKEPKLCRGRRDLISWNRQQNHLLRRLRFTGEFNGAFLTEQYRRHLC